ncbi:MAG: chromosome segregation protein [Thermomicrobiales bacterium]|nr:chromosome segregation protein [Thermomicrobiales bacterium]
MPSGRFSPAHGRHNRPEAGKGLVIMIPSPSAPPRLTRLELHGFKSFANRTVFLFEPGITAIIGPNGSGKSNISDAVRWVLGEQSHSSLRSKKTEDVIFAGGSGRAPVGMAEVAVTFDNTSGWLPIAFGEVTVTRRAFRSGENQYLINGRKVRLKDVAHLTASLGHSYTVVGQGLVDAALSQRAEERRGLFEHAADLTGLRLKAAEAERSLAETESNSTRLTDLLDELEPRLKSLERGARQAREWKGVHDRLLELQQVHYGRLLREAKTRLAEAERAAASDEERVAASRQELDRLSAAATTARTEAEDARATLAQHAVRLQSTIDAARRVGHERDLADERHAALTRRREDMADTQAGLDDQVAAVERELAGVALDLKAAEKEVAAARTAVTILQAEGAAARQTRRDQERRAATLAASIGERERTLADLVRRRALLDQRRETDTAEQERAAASTAERTTRLDRLAAELAAFDEAEAAAAANLAEIDAKLAGLTVESERAVAAERSARETVSAAERRVGEVAARLEGLRRLHESGAGLYAGVRETLGAARAGKLHGIRGTVAELIEVPARYDTAIEVALGAHLQDVVVERWADAETAIAHLKRSNAGRATFQPLDTIRPGRGGAPREALGLPGVHGVASELVSAALDLGVVASALLGRTLVVEDLPTSRATLPHLPVGWSAVTLAGEIARTGGSVTGGAAVRESGVLGRERELRELPRELKRLEQARDQAQAALREAAETPRRLVEERREQETARAGFLATRKERQGQRARLAGWLNDLRAEQTTADRRLAALAAAAETAHAETASLERDQVTLHAEAGALREQRDALQAQLARETEVATASEQQLAAEQRRLAALDERLRAERRRETGLRAQRQGLDEELALRAERAAALDGELAALAAQRDRLATETATLTAARDAVQAERPPLEASVKRTETEVARLDRTLEAARNALLEAERARGASGLVVERARGELGAIRQRITDDLELDNPDDLVDESRAIEEVSSREENNSSPPRLPDSLPADMEREIGRLKERLRRVGYVGENAVEEYEREAERQVFLREQLADVQGAAESLRSLLADLHLTMRQRFDETFARVAAVFSETFTTLFGGGTARLVLVAGENGDGAGVDIVAQPPGKRLQSLALLSGGERSLTAAALLFAILRVNPTPFCLLDEVDAALDEANVVRFREQLRSLAAETQAIVITHNRGTIEVADTLYGVSMREDGVSQVLSLRLADAVVAG